MAYPASVGTGLVGSAQKILFEAQNGAHGNFSYVDVAKYGTRDYATAPVGWTYVDGSRLIIPGGGGGARPLPTYKRGSKSTGYLPKGVVLIRLVRITT